MILRNLWRRKMRTLLTLLGIAVGIAAMVTLVALSRGIVSNYVQVTSRSDAHLLIQAVQGQGEAITIGTGFDESILHQLRAMPEVKSAAGVVFTMVRMADLPVFIIFGYEPDQIGIQHFKIIDGVTLAKHRSRRGGKPILLGKVAADSLKKSVGDTVRLEQTTFRVVGIYETGTAMEDAAGVISLRDAQILANIPHQVIYVGLRLHHPDRVEQFKAKLKRILPKGVEIAGTQAGSMMLEMLEMLDVYAWGVAMIAALVGGVGMTNTMLMSVYERTREIGALRAVGWSRWRVMRMILVESLLLSLLGGALGLGVGAALTYFAAHSPVLAGMTTDSVPVGVMAQALTATLFLGVVGGVYPAWYASRLAPVEALSYDGGASRKRAFNIPWGGMALKSLLRQRTRTLLTLVGVGIGLLGVLLIGALSEGAVSTFNSTLAGAEITASEANQADTSLSSIDERVLKRIEALPEVQYVTGIIMSVVSTPNDPFFIIMARSRTDPALNHRILREGKLLSGRRQCLLGGKAAIQQGRGIGDRISMLGTTFTIVGIVDTGRTYEDNGAIIDLREAQQLLKKPRQVMAMQIKLVDPNQTEEMVARLSAAYPELLLTKSAEFAESLPDMESMDKSMGAIFALMAVVGSITLMNTMMMSVYERTREIGVLRAVGWRRLMVLRQMLGEAVLLTMFSGLAGLATAVGLIQLVRAMPSLGIIRDMLLISPKVVAQGLVMCLVLGLAGGLIPAWRATRLSPVEALRYE